MYEAIDFHGVGPGQLDRFEDQQLVRLVLGVSADSPLPAQLLEKFGPVAELPGRGCSELSALAGIGPRKALRLLAGMQLGVRATCRDERGRAVVCSRQVYDRFRHLAVLQHETFWIVALDVRNRVLRHIRVAEGGLTSCVITPREVFRPLLQEAAANTIVVHNHPSGDPTPSADDIALTDRLARAGEMVGIGLLDHIIVGRGRYTSLCDAGLIGGRERPDALRAAGG